VGERFRLWAVDALDLLAQGFDANALVGDALFTELIREQYLVDQLVTDLGGQVLQEPPCGGRGLVDRETEAEGELGRVLEERVVPRRPAPVLVLRIGGRRQIAAVDRRAAGGVADQQPVAGSGA
jgi:hypothetical protein